jgi:hypothetical protein
MKQRMAENIIELLHADGIQLENSELESLGQKSVSDLVFDYLKSSGSQTPSHYRDIANAIMSQGIPLPGKEPAANLLAHIGRDDRFVRVSPGTYGLKEWGLEPASQKTRRRKRRKPTK